jgi:hypothetical protein
MKALSIISTCVLVFCLACQSRTSKTNENQYEQFDSVKIVNHTPNHYIKHSISINYSSDIQDIKSQLDLLNPVQDMNLKANQGLYELILFNKGEEVETWDVTYTTYDGVVITNENTNRQYKNNKLEMLLLALLSD